MNKLLLLLIILLLFMTVICDIACDSEDKELTSYRTAVLPILNNILDSEMNIYMAYKEAYSSQTEFQAYIQSIKQHITTTQEQLTLLNGIIAPTEAMENIQCSLINNLEIEAREAEIEVGRLHDYTGLSPGRNLGYSSSCLQVMTTLNSLLIKLNQ